MRLRETNWMDRHVSLADLHTSLYEVSVRASNETLEMLARTDLWPAIAAASKDQNWWYRRTEYLVGRKLEHRQGDWASVYNSIKSNGLTLLRDKPLDLIFVHVMFELGVVPSAQAILSAIGASTREVFALLLAHPKSHVFYAAIEDAVAEDDYDALELLLQDGRADPTSDDSLAIRVAADMGSTRAVELLLADGRSDASAEHNDAIVTAAQFGFEAMFSLLILNEQVRAYADRVVDGYGLVQAILGGHVGIVKLILRNIRTVTEHALALATKTGNILIVRLILERDPELPRYHSERVAKRLGYIEIAELLKR